MRLENRVGIILVLSVVVLLGLTLFAIGKTTAQIDPTAQQQTADAMVAQILGATQTVQAASAIPTETPATTNTPSIIPTPAPQVMVLMVQVPYQSGIDSNALQATISAVVANYRDQLQTTSAVITPEVSPSSVDSKNPTPPPSSMISVSPITQWQYLFVNACYATGSHITLELESTAPIAEALQTVIGQHDVNTQSPIDILQIAGLYGWEVMSMTTGYSAFDYWPNGTYDQSSLFIQGNQHCYIYLTFKRATSFPILPAK